MKPTTDTPASPSFWQRSGPALKAALLVSWVLVVQEIIGDALPVIGNAIFLPLWLAVYYIQGLLVGYFARRSPETRQLSAAAVARLGLVSALWTSVVFSLIVMITGIVLSSTATAGLALLTLPLIVGGSLLDFVTNVSLTVLGAWLYAWLNQGWLTCVSCGVIAILLLVFVTMLAGAGAAIYFWGGSLLHWISQQLQLLLK
jgi:hypothetical protein